MSDSPHQGPTGPDHVEVEHSGLPEAIAGKFGPDITRALSNDLTGPYEVNVQFGEGRPSDEDLDAIGLFAMPGGDMASGQISRADLVRLASHPSVLEVSGWSTSTPR
ncbi:MAG: hypothetical protein AAF799_35595 [Myxococcota bacterium]